MNSFSSNFLTNKTNLTNCQMSQRMSGNVTISTNHSSWVAWQLHTAYWLNHGWDAILDLNPGHGHFLFQFLHYFYTFFSCFFLPVTSLMLRRLMFVIPSLLYTDFIMTQMSYLTWILDFAIFRRKKIIFCIFYIFNVHYQLRGSFKDTFTLVFFWFWSSISKILSKKQTCTHFSADFFLPVHSLMLRRLMFEIPGLTGHDEKSYELWLFYL